MFQAGIILDELYESLDAVDAKERKDVLRTLNIAYMEEARSASWAEMRKSMAATNGTRLPSNLIGIDGIYDADGNSYVPRERFNIGVDGDDPVRRWFYSSASTSPLFHARGVTIAQGTKDITFSPVLGSDPTGEFIVFGNDIGMYEFASATQLVNLYMGEAQVGGWYKIRPEGTKTLGLRDADGDADTTSVTVDYYAVPSPIYGDTDVILLPTTEALMLRALKRYYKVHKQDLPRAGTFNDEYEFARQDALSRNPRYINTTSPRNRIGGIAGWGAQHT